MSTITRMEVSGTAGHIIVGKKHSTAPGYSTIPALRGQIIRNRALLCCGLATIEGFNTLQLTTFQEKADYLEALYAQNPAAKNYLYLVNRQQHGGKDGQTNPAPEHALLLEIGAECIHKFKNLNSSNDLFIYMVNITDAVGPYLKAGGIAYKEDPFKKEKEAAALLLKEQRTADMLAGKDVPFAVGDTVILRDNARALMERYYGWSSRLSEYVAEKKELVLITVTPKGHATLKCGHTVMLKVCQHSCLVGLSTSQDKPAQVATQPKAKATKVVAEPIDLA